jgi:Family of unknown function (DUF695)
MTFLKNLFGSKKEATINTYQDFWTWFVANEAAFYKTLKAKFDRDNVDKNILTPVITQLHKLNDQFYCQVGMESDGRGELVITPEGDIKTFVFVDELLAVAPKLDNWLFTNLKTPVPISCSITMDGFVFDTDTMGFYANVLPEYPDEIDITLAHKAYNEADKKTIINGSFIYLDSILGELNSVTLLDAVTIAGIDPNRELIPMSKLNDFLIWREKEFVEKYKGTRHTEENDAFFTYEAETEEGAPIVAIMNQSLLQWPAKPSHPWLLTIECAYNGSDNNGLPNAATFDLMNQFEDELLPLLPMSEGYLSVGRQSGLNKRTNYWACKEFKKSSKIVFDLIKKYEKRLPMTYEITKDKYWMTLNQFIHA